jgi:hypothetical protein
MLRVPRHGTVGTKRVRMVRSRRSVTPDWALLRGETLTGHPMLVLAPGPAGAEAPRAGEDGAEPETYQGLAEAASRFLQAELEDVALRRSGGSRAPERPRTTEQPPLGLTSFDRSADEVHRWVGALGHPRPGAFATMRGENVVIWSCEPVDARAIQVPPGTVLGPDDHGVVVTTRTGTVRLLEVQGEGHGPEPAVSWFARRGLPPGCAFEPVGWTPLDWLLG